MSTHDESTVAENAVTFVPAEDSPIEPARWAERYERIRSSCAENDIDPRDLRRTARDMHLTDAAGTTWRYDGTRWQRRERARWRTATPEAPLRLEPFTLDYPLAPDAEFDPQAEARARVAAHGVPGTPEFLRSMYGFSGRLRLFRDRIASRAGRTRRPPPPQSLPPPTPGTRISG